MLPLFLFASAVTFRTDFEAGNLGKTEVVGPAHYRCHVVGEVDQDKRNRQASNYQPNQGAIIAGTPPYYREDQKTWRPVEDAVFDDSVPMFRLRVKPGSDRGWIAHQPPYTNQNLATLIADIRRHPAFSVRSVGKTLGGREIPLITITDASVPDASKKVLWILFRQ